MLGEDSPEAQPLKEAVEKAQNNCRVLPAGELANDTTMGVSGWPRRQCATRSCFGPHGRSAPIPHPSRSCPDSRKGAFGGGCLALFSTCWLTQRCGMSQKTSGKRSRARQCKGGRHCWRAQQQELLRFFSQKNWVPGFNGVAPSSAEVVQDKVQLSLFGTLPDAHFLRHFFPKKKIEFNIEAQARIEKMEAELGREKTLLQQALVSLERLRDEAANSVSEPPHNSRPPQTQMDVEGPEEEVWGLRAQVAECSKSEWRRVVPRRLGFCPHQRWICPIAFWSSKITQHVKFDAEPHQCSRFYVERSRQC